MSERLLKTSGKPLQGKYALALLDLDGVVYRGKNPVENAASAIGRAARAGMTITYTTNNPSRTEETVANQIRSFGIKVSPSQIITSALVAARLLQKRLPKGAKVYVCGGEPLKSQVSAHGLRVVQSADDHPQAVIAGWYPDIGWKSLAQACIAVEHGALFFATNRDLTLPREEGMTPGIGAFVNAIITTTGRKPVASAGKPQSAMYDEERAIRAGAGGKPIPTASCLPVGDRLDTDIEAANRGGYDSLCVLTGVARARTLLLASPLLRPTYISKDLRGLGRAHVAPRRVSLPGADVAYSLEGISAEYSEKEGSITLHTHTGGADPRTSVDGLRAACQLCWTLADRGVNLSNLHLPEFHL